MLLLSTFVIVFIVSWFLKESQRAAYTFRMEMAPETHTGLAGWILCGEGTDRSE